MTLSSEERDAIVTYRIQKAGAALEEAQGNLQMGYWTVVANRLYYAAYYAVSALLIHKGFQAQTHAGINSLFNLHFVSKGLVPKESGKFYGRLFRLWQTGDYDDIYSLAKEDVDYLIEPTGEFISRIKEMITS